MNTSIALDLFRAEHPDVFDTERIALGCADGTDDGHWCKDTYLGKNPDGGSGHKHRARATWLLVYGDAGGNVPCAACHEYFALGEASGYGGMGELAHIIPKDDGGAFCTRNIVWTCSRECNDAMQYAEHFANVGNNWLPERISRALLKQYTVG